jgi:hypothetical protein
VARSLLRSGTVYLAVVCVAIGSLLGLALHQSTVTVLSQGQWSDNASLSPMESTHHVFDFEAGFNNSSSGPVTLRSISFAYGLPVGVHVVHKDAVANGGTYAYPEAGWPPKGMTHVHPLDGFSVPARSSALVIVAVTIARPGCYYLRNPTISADRGGFWGGVPFVGPDQTLKLNWLTVFCAGANEVATDSSGIANLTADSPQTDLIAGVPVLVERVAGLVQRDTKAASITSGEYIDELADGATAKSWFTTALGTGSFQSGSMDVSTGWSLAITSRDCPHGADPTKTRMWIERPNGSERNEIVGSGGLAAGSGGDEAGKKPASGPIVLVVKSSCAWQVEIGTTAGQIGM